MIRAGHLEEYDLVLTTCGPLHIGSGVYHKDNYLVDFRQGVLSIVDRERLFQWLVEHDKLEEYELFALNYGNRGNLYRFLKDNGITAEELRQLAQYKMSCKGVLNDYTDLQEINKLMRGPDGQPYVPGSSVKGALRTALLTHMILQDPRKKTLPPKGRIPEEEYLNLLGQNDRKKANAVNSILRALSIADGQPLSNACLMLTAKVDRTRGGGQIRRRILRECIAPGTELHFRLTLDCHYGRDELRPEALRQALAAYDAFYQETFREKFHAQPMPLAEGEQFLLLGGGSGYFSKTLVYPYLGEERGGEDAQATLCRSFRKHHHENDLASSGFSPRYLRYADDGQELLEMGLCKVEIR